MLAHLKSWWTLHLSLITAVLYFFIPSITAWMNAHPKTMVSSILGIVFTSLLKKSPALQLPSGTSGLGAVVILLMLAFAGSANAQVSSTAITISGNFSGFNGSGNVSASSNIGAALQVTQRISLGFNQITVPSLNRAYSLGVFNYTAPLSAILGKNLSSKFVFDTTQINVTFQGGIGKVTQSATAATATAPATTPFNVLSESGGVFVSYPLSMHVSAQLLGVQYLHGGTNPSHAVFSTGLNFQF